MTRERWQQIQDLVESALELPETERRAFVHSSCDGDGSLREEVEAMLEVDTQLGGFIETPIVDLHGDRGGLAAGDLLGPWQIEREIGKGGMGAVYLAERADASFSKRVAVKLLKRGMDTDDLVRRFRGERRILARLEHPNIARLLDGGSTPDGRPYLVMEYVEGRPIDAWCAERALPIEERLKLFEKVCRAVHFAHRNLVVHRDLKPGNILVLADGEPRLLDFGIAKILEGDPEPNATVAAFLPMTPEYASPEQIRGEPVTTGTDVYSLGVILYRLLVGRSPYRPPVEGRAALAEAVCNQEPQRPSTAVLSRGKVAAEKRGDAERQLAKRLRGDLDTIVQKAMAKEPARRYESAEQLAADVRRYLDGMPVLARPASRLYRLGKFVRRNKMGVAFTTAAVLAILGTTALALFQKMRAENEAERANWSKNFMLDVFRAPSPTTAKGREVTAVELLDRAREQLGIRKKEQPSSRAVFYSALGQIYSQLGKYQQAKAASLRALTLHGEAGERGKPETAETLVALSDIFRNLGEDAQAEATALEGLAVVDGTRGVEYVKALNQVGGVLQQEKRYGEAERYFRRAAAVPLGKGTDERRASSITLAGLGEAISGQGREKESIGFYKRSITLRHDLYGNDSIEVAKTMNSLASVLDEFPESFREAEGLYLETIRIRKKILGANHPDVAKPLSNLARLYEKSGEWGEVEARYREAVAICERTKEEDRNCSTYLSHLAAFVADRREACGEAKNLAEKAISLAEAKARERVPMAEARGVIGQCLRERRDFAAAEPLLAQALAELPKNPTPLVESRIRKNLAELKVAMGRPVSADR